MLNLLKQGWKLACQRHHHHHHVQLLAVTEVLSLWKVWRRKDQHLQHKQVVITWNQLHAICSIHQCHWYKCWSWLRAKNITTSKLCADNVQNNVLQHKSEINYTVWIANTYSSSLTKQIFIIRQVLVKVCVLSDIKFEVILFFLCGAGYHGGGANRSAWNYAWW